MTPVSSLRKAFATMIMLTLLIIGASPMVQMAAAQPAEGARVSRVIEDMSRARAQGDYGKLYDFIVPDVRLMFPRQAFVNWWSGQPAPQGQISIRDLSIASGTYALTGTDYESIATVDIAFASAADGSEQTQTVQLAFADGTWRWIPDITTNEASAIQQDEAYTVSYTSPYSTERYQELDTYWAQIFADAGAEYSSPVDMVGVRVAGTATRCGPIDDLNELFAQYCSGDQTIYFNPEMRDLVVERWGQWAWDSIIAHEWGHHVQWLSGSFVGKDPELLGGNYSIEHELQADCLSAMFVQDGYARGEVSDRDVNNITDLLNFGGDSSSTIWADPQAHGSGEQRQQSFFLGFDDGMRGCYLNLTAGQ